MTYKYNVKGVGLDQIFDPYISGTKAAITNYQVSGVDLKDIFAPLYLGTSAAVTNYKVKGADLNTIFAAYGTATYPLPMNGGTFLSTATTAGSSSTAGLAFNTNASTYSVVDDVSTNVLASGSIPTGATQVMVTTTLTNGTVATSYANNMSSIVALTTPSLQLDIHNTHVGAGYPQLVSYYTVVIQYYNVSSVLISTTTIYFRVVNHST